MSGSIGWRDWVIVVVGREGVLVRSSEFVLESVCLGTFPAMPISQQFIAATVISGRGNEHKVEGAPSMLFG